MAIHQAGENLRQMGHGQSGASKVVLPFSRWAGWRSEPRLTHVEKTSRYFHAIIQGWPVDIPNITIYPTVVLFDGQIILNHTKSQDLSIWNYHKLATFPRFLKVFACFNPPCHSLGGVGGPHFVVNQPLSLQNGSGTGSPSYKMVGL